jgi:hypothetical protein
MLVVNMKVAPGNEIRFKTDLKFLKFIFRSLRPQRNHSIELAWKDAG